MNDGELLRGRDTYEPHAERERGRYRKRERGGVGGVGGVGGGGAYCATILAAFSEIIHITTGRPSYL